MTNDKFRVCKVLQWRNQNHVFRRESGKFSIFNVISPCAFHEI